MRVAGIFLIISFIVGGAFASPLKPIRNVYTDSLGVTALSAMPSDKKIQRHFDKNFAKEKKTSKLHKQAKELEAVLLSKMIEPMFPDGEDSDIYGGGHGSDIFRSMMIDEYGRTMVEAGGIGIAGSIEKDFLRKQQLRSK